MPYRISCNVTCRSFCSGKDQGSACSMEPPTSDDDDDNGDGASGACKKDSNDASHSSSRASHQRSPAELRGVIDKALRSSFSGGSAFLGRIATNVPLLSSRVPIAEGQLKGGSLSSQIDNVDDVVAMMLLHVLSNPKT